MPEESIESGQTLPTNAHLEEFVIEKVLGSGGFGITYLAKDTSLGRKVVIKENLPAQFAWRETSTGTVRPRNTSGGDVDDFAWSMNNFLREAETLASLDHPGIVRVLRKFEANGTAYFVMPFVEGIPFDALVESRRKRGEMFSEVELGGLLSRMLDALGYLHDHGIYHRDIKPGNILVTLDGIPVLIDFGSARQRISNHSMTVVESAGYTPFEQLQSQGNVGPWSDLYALAATIVKAITFETPPKANDRIRKDPHVPLAQREELATRFSENFLQAIDKAMAVDEEERWQNAGEWLAAMRQKAVLKTVVPVPVPSSPFPQPQLPVPSPPPQPHPRPQQVLETVAPPAPLTSRKPKALTHENRPDWQVGANDKPAKNRAIMIGAAALVAVGVFVVISKGKNPPPQVNSPVIQVTPPIGPSPSSDASATQREVANFPNNASVNEQAKQEADIKQQVAESMERQQRDIERLQKEAEATELARQKASAMREAQAKREEASSRRTNSTTSEEQTPVKQEKGKSQLANQLAPLHTPDLASARLAIDNLTKLAATQTGAIKVGTERLANAIKNLFTAEFQVLEAVKARNESEIEAAKLDRVSQEWLQPNQWGRVNTDASRAAADKATALRSKAAQRVTDARQKLAGQLRETESLIEDFNKNEDSEVAAVLTKASQAVAARTPTEDPSRSSYQNGTTTPRRTTRRSGGF